MLTIQELTARKTTGAMESRMEIVPNATHLFEETGVLKQVARLAAGWFQRYLNPEMSEG